MKKKLLIIILVLGIFNKTAGSWPTPLPTSNFVASQDVLATSSDSHDVGKSGTNWLNGFFKNIRFSERGEAPSTISSYGTVYVSIDNELYYQNDAGTSTRISASSPGDVSGPSSATDNAVTRFDGTTGKLVQNSQVIIDDSGNITRIGSASFDNSGTIKAPAAASQTLKIQGYNVSGAAYTDLVTVTSGNSPSLDFSSVVTKNGDVIGNVSGPSSSSHNQLSRFRGATGRSIDNSQVIIDDSGNMTRVQSVSFDNSGLIKGPAASSQTVKLQGYDVDGGSYTDLMTMTSGNNPSLDLSVSVTKNGNVICDTSQVCSGYQATLSTGNLTATSPVAVSATRQVIGGAAAISINNDGIGPNQIDETANYLFSGALINTGTNPTVNTAGMIAEDTTSNDIVYGSSAKVLTSKRGASVTVPDVSATDDNFLFFMAPRRAITITDFACRYEGTGTTTAQFRLEDGGGNVMTHATPTCVSGDTAAAFVSVTAGGSLVSGEGLKFDVTNTPSPTTDDYSLLVLWEYDRV